MSLNLKLLFDAIFASPESYRQLHAGASKSLFTKRASSLKAEDIPSDEQAENRIFISGGRRDTRLRVLEGFMAQQLKAGHAVVLIQPANASTYTISASFPQISLSACDGTYDPLFGQSSEDAVRMLSDSAVACGLSVAEAASLNDPIMDEMNCFATTQNTVHIGDFVQTNSREIGKMAFAQGDEILSESHEDRTTNAQIDWLRSEIKRSCCFKFCGLSITSAVKPGGITVVRIPQSSAAWISFVLYELTDLQNRWLGFDVLPVFLEINISETCRSTVEGLPGGCCFCYSDLPALGWLWTAAAAACSIGCVLQHHGNSAKIISDYFGKQRVAKIANTTSSGVSRTDSGGLMGIFGTNTLSNSRGCTVSYEWEPVIPENAIRELDDDEGIFLYKNFNKPFRIN